MFKYAICLAGLVVTIAASSSAHAGEALSAREILGLTPGTFHAVVKGKYELTVILSRDGTAVGKVPGIEDRGRWTVRNNQLCIVLPVWTRGHVVCSAVIADNGWYRGRSVAFRKF